MLSPALLKENIDGEALEWAALRLLQRPERRKILIVLSDGAPVDQATLERNADRAILDRHLRQVIQRLTANSGIELCAIGIRHDVSFYYPVSRKIEQIPELADAVVALLDSLLVSA
jgi:cobaltochelatase CobT